MQNGLRDTTPRNPAAADDIWLYNAVDVTATWLAGGFGSPEPPPFSPRRSTTRRRTFCAGKRGVSDETRTRDRRDHNPQAAWNGHATVMLPSTAVLHGRISFRIRSGNPPSTHAYWRGLLPRTAAKICAICRPNPTDVVVRQPIAMQKVEGSSPFIRLKIPANRYFSGFAQDP
jgi:hypothetical protein